MTVQYSITLDDLRAFQHYLADTSPIAKRNYHFTLLSVPIAVAILVLVITSFSFSSIWVFVLVFASVWFVLYPRAYRRSLDTAVTQMMAQGKNKGTLGDHTLTISEHELHETTEVNDSRWSWSGIERIEHTEHYIFIFIGPLMAHVIPKRAFSTAEEAVTFFSTATRYFDQAKRAITME